MSSPSAPAEPSAEVPQSAAARLFDIRSMIGGLFVLYGILLTVAGFFTSAKNLAKAANININLWLGIAMLIAGILFLTWWRLNPLKVEANPTGAGTEGAGAGTATAQEPGAAGPGAGGGNAA